MKLPPGFPVKLGMLCSWSLGQNSVSATAKQSLICAHSLSLRPFSDIPVFPTITATVTFQEFRYSEFEESIFAIPAEYKEDPSRFPDL